jgi:hypothetical protein
MQEDGDSRDSMSADELDDTMELVTKMTEAGRREGLDEAKVRLRIEELQQQMLELANAQVVMCLIERRGELPERSPSSDLREQQDFQQADW